MLAALVAFLIPAMLPGEPFADLSFDAALTRAKTQEKLLLVDFTAAWCGPCHTMEKDTWAAADVRAWLGENAVAIQVDVDKQRDLAQRFRIEAMPTVVALRGGEEFDRIVGYRDAGRFLAWGRDVRAGKRASDALLARSKELRESTDAHARYDLAQELARAGFHDEALVHYLWLWPATRSVTGFGGVRLSFMLGDMAGLASRSDAARKAFEEIFAGLQAKIDAAAVPTFDDWQEWTAFCQYFGGGERIVAWYEKHRDERGQLQIDTAAGSGYVAELIVNEVFDVLIQKERHQDAVRLYEDARKRAERVVEEYRQLPPPPALDEESRRQFEGYNRGRLIESLSKLYGALLLAERREEAEGVAAKLLEALDTPDARLGLVRRGLDLTKKADPAFARWLDEAEAAGGDARSLRRRLERLDGDAKGRKGG